MRVRKTLCKLGDIPDGGATVREVENADDPHSLILLRRSGQVFAYRNECPHAGRRLDWAPGRFLIENGQLICAAHGACFLVETGRCIDGPARGDALTPVAIEIVDGEVRTL